MENEEPFDEEQLNRLGLEISSNLMSSSLYSLPSFNGDSSKSATAWLTKFEMICSHFNWSDEQAKARFRNFMSGPASNWYRLRIESSQELLEMNLIKRIFLEDFADEDKLEKMRKRKLNRFEKIQSYVYDKVSLCKNVNKLMTGEEILNYVYEGMPEC